MNWYMQSGKDSDVAISTRIRFARNLNGFKFNLDTPEEIERLENKIKENLYSIGYNLKFLKLKDMDDITKMSLVEKNIISPEFVLNKNDMGAILINDEENICIMINEEDHLRIQVFNSGLDLENAFVLYENRDFCTLECAFFHVSEDMKKDLVSYIMECEGYVERMISPPKSKDTKVCRYCNYKQICGKVG